MEKTSTSSYSASFLTDFIGLFLFHVIPNWVTGYQKFYCRALSFLQTKSKASFERKSANSENGEKLKGVVCQLPHINDRGDDLSREDVEMVMETLGIFGYSEGGKLKDRVGCEELSVLFEEKEPSLEEVKEAFCVFDQNQDGFIDAKELQRVLCCLGFRERSSIDGCEQMIRAFDVNLDGRIDFNERVEKEDVLNRILQSAIIKIGTQQGNGAESDHCWPILLGLGILMEPKLKETKTIKWRPLDPGWQKVNTDASTKEEEVGISIITKDHLCNVLWMRSHKVSQIINGTILHYKLQAILDALTIACKDLPVWVEPDSKVDCEIILRNFKCPWTESILLAKIEAELALFTARKILHIWRERNGVVEVLSKVLDLNGRNLTNSNIPFELQCVIAHDRDGKIYERV